MKTSYVHRPSLLALLRNSIISGALLLFGSISFGQEFTGKYIMQQTLGGDHSTVFQFNRDSTFTEIAYYNFNLSAEKKGIFRFKNDTLTLTYIEPVKKMVTVRQQELVQPDASTKGRFANVYINLFNRAYSSPGNSTIHFKGAEDNVVLSTPINDTYAITLYDDQLKSAIISALGDHDVEIDLEPLMGYSTTLDVHYTKVNYPVTRPDRQQFYVEILENGLLRLHPLNQDRAPWVIQKAEDLEAN